MPTFRQDTKIGGMVPMMKTDDINDQAITKDKIRDGNVTAEKLADGAVSTDKLPDGAIKTPKIADGNITTSKLAEASVVTSKIADQNVTNKKIADQSVDNSKLSPEAVTYDKLKDKAIITEKINDRAVTTEKVEEKAITNAKIGDSAVDGRVISEASVEKKHLANDSVATEKLQDSAITSDKIHIHAVTEEKIEDSAISNSKLADNSVGTSKIKDGNVTNEKVANNTITIDKFDPELRKSIQAATGLPENLVEVIQDVDVEVKSLHSKDEDLQSQIADKQQQITANDKDIESLQNRSTQMEQSINNIAVTGGASVANTVAYSNTASGLVSINAQGAIDELAAKNATKAEKTEVTAELEKKFDKESILQESGDAEDKVMSQKAVSDKLSDLSNKTQFYDCSNGNATFGSLEEAIKSVPDTIKKGNLTISFLSKDNYLRKFTLNSNSWSEDTSLWIEQQYLENSESILFKIADIFGISPFTIFKDGVVNIPLLKSRTITKLNQLIKSLTDLVNSNSTQVSAELDKKVDKEEGKSLADNDIIDSISLRTFKSIFAMTDSNDVIVLKIDENGKLIPCSQELIDVQKSPYLFTIVDSNNHILFAIRKDGRFIPRLLKEKDLNNINSALSTIESRIKVLEDGQKVLKTIVCFGDSLTAGAGGQGTTYESVMQAELGDSYKVINCGVGGEQVYPITARQGGIVSFLANEVSIPIDKTEVEIGTKTDSGVHCLKLDGTEVALPLLLQGHGNSVNPCYIDDIPCTLRWSGSSYEDTGGKYFLKSNIELSKAHKVVAKSPIYFSGNTLRNSHAFVIWMGQNGGFETVDELKELYKKAISHSGCSNYVIIGLHGYYKNIEEDLEKQFKQEFGNHFIDWRNYLLTRALDDANIIPTEQDLADIDKGLCPTSLRYDSVHLNAIGYTLLAKQILNRFKYLGVI